MHLISVVDEDFVNYKEASMFLIFPHCSFKCDKENGTQLCQNSALIHEPILQISSREIIDRYDSNPITAAIVCGGLEPFDSGDELHELLMNFRYAHYDTIVIYTGYSEQEVREKFSWVFLYENIIIKYGRFRPNQKPHYDKLLGVELANDEQYAKHYN